MKKYQNNLSLVLYTIIHFAVDLACLYYMTGQIRSVCYVQEDIIGLAILYNFCAFGLPMLMGLIADRTEKNDWLASLGCLLIVLVYACNIGASASLAVRAQVSMLIPPIPACVIMGIGNGLFHIGSGRQVLQDAAGKYSKPGIFISAGAFGVFLGKAWADPFNRVPYFIILGVLCVFAIYLACLGIVRKKIAAKNAYDISAGGVTSSSTTSGFEAQKSAASSSTASGFEAQKSAVSSSTTLGFEASKCSAPNTKTLGCESSQKTTAFSFLSWGVLSLFIVVIIRSFYGCALSYSWNSPFLIGLIFTASVFAGKFLGGIVADHLGVTLASVISLGGAGILVLFSRDSVILGCISILLFNMTMPLTLTLLAEYWKNYPGFAFGTLMMALFLGTLPTMVFKVPKFSSLFYAFAFCIMSMVILINAIYLRKKQ